MANYVGVSMEELKVRYESMLNNVANMLDRNGPVYSTWIKFQMGLDTENSVVFNTASRDVRENLIASLSVTKSGGGIANEFTLVVHYDPFNFGQNTDLRGNVEKLDSFIADAMSEGFDKGTKQLRCKIQYGYNSFSSYTDDDLKSPEYTLFLTGAKSNVNFDSGITTYTFTGVSELSVDCDFVTDFEGIEDDNMLLSVGRILYKYYGDENNKPEFLASENVTPIQGITSYYIDIQEKDIEASVNISKDKSTAVQSPWRFCQSILDENPLTKEELDSGIYDDENNVISINKRPRYSMYLTDIEGKKTIHVVHIEPSQVTVNGQETETNALSIDYVFSWGVKNENLVNKNIVTGWRPEVNLYTYLIQNANHIRYTKLKELAKTSKEYQKALDNYSGYTNEVLEMYNAELEIVGVPADPPFGAEIQVLPRILETFSRTSGIYIITGASDEISNNGVFRSKLKLVRKGNINVEKVMDAPQVSRANEYHNNKSGTVSVETSQKYTTNPIVKRELEKKISENNSGGNSSSTSRFITNPIITNR